jgi:hypothetical protein
VRQTPIFLYIIARNVLKRLLREGSWLWILCKKEIRFMGSKKPSPFAHYCVVCKKLTDPVNDTVYFIGKLYNANKREKRIYYCEKCFLDYAGEDVDKEIERKGVEKEVITPLFNRVF